MEISEEEYEELMIPDDDEFEELIEPEDEPSFLSFDFRQNLLVEGTHEYTFKKVLETLGGFDFKAGDLSNELYFKLDDYEFYLYDNDRELKIEDSTTDKYIGSVDMFDPSNDQFFSAKELAEKTKNLIWDYVLQIKKLDAFAFGFLGAETEEEFPFESEDVEQIVWKAHTITDKMILGFINPDKVKYTFEVNKYTGKGDFLNVFVRVRILDGISYSDEQMKVFIEEAVKEFVKLKETFKYKNYDITPKNPTIEVVQKQPFADLEIIMPFDLAHHQTTGVIIEDDDVELDTDFEIEYEELDFDIGDDKAAIVEAQEELKTGDIASVEQTIGKVIARYAKDVDFKKPHNFLKVLSILNSSFAAKHVNVDSEDLKLDYLFVWEIDKATRIITSDAALDAGWTKHIWICSENEKNLDRIEAIIRTRAGFLDAFVDVDFYGTTDLTKVVRESLMAVDDGQYAILANTTPEPLTSITYKEVDKAMVALGNIRSIGQLITLFALQKLEDENNEMAYDSKKRIKMSIEAMEEITLPNKEGQDLTIVLKDKIIKHLVKSGLLNQNYRLTTVAKTLIRLHDYCFQKGLHPFSRVYYTLKDVNMVAGQIKYANVDDETYYSGDGNVFVKDIGVIPSELMEDADNSREWGIQLSSALEKNRNWVEYVPYSYCLGLSYEKVKTDQGKKGYVNVSPTDLGFVVMNNFKNNNELYVSSIVLNFVKQWSKLKGGEIKKLQFYASEDAKSGELLLVGYLDKDGAFIKIGLVRTFIADNLSGVFNYSFSLYDLDEIEKSNIENSPVLYKTGVEYDEFKQGDSDIFIQKQPEIEEDAKSTDIQETEPVDTPSEQGENADGVVKVPNIHDALDFDDAQLENQQEEGVTASVMRNDLADYFIGKLSSDELLDIVEDDELPSPIEVDENDWKVDEKERAVILIDDGEFKTRYLLPALNQWTNKELQDQYNEYLNDTNIEIPIKTDYSEEADLYKAMKEAEEKQTDDASLPSKIYGSPVAFDKAFLETKTMPKGTQKDLKILDVLTDEGQKVVRLEDLAGIDFETEKWAVDVGLLIVDDKYQLVTRDFITNAYVIKKL